MKLRPLAYQLARMEINSGSNSYFWWDNWSPLGRLIELTGDGGCIALGIPINSTVERAIQLYKMRLHRLPVFRQIEQEVLKLRNQGLNTLEDVCLWKQENGNFKMGFSTSHTWNITRSSSPKVGWSRGIWIAEITPKFAFITWLAMHNRLATGDRVLRWNPQAITTCWLCKVETETRDHMLFECSYSKEVWKGIIGNLAGNGNGYSWVQVTQVVVNGLQERIPTFLLRYSFQAVVYALWHERNVRRVGESSQPASCLIARIDKLVRNRITSLRKRNGGRYEKAMEIWFGRL